MSRILITRPLTLLILTVQGVGLLVAALLFVR